MWLWRTREGGLSLLKRASLPRAVEGFPLTIVEALACGVPVILSPLGGVGEVMPHGVSGLHSEPENAVDLCRRGLTTLGDTALRGLGRAYPVRSALHG